MMWDGQGRAVLGGCNRSCCWTPYGHRGDVASCSCHSIDDVRASGWYRDGADYTDTPRASGWSQP